MSLHPYDGKNVGKQVQEAIRHTLEKALKDLGRRSARQETQDASIHSVRKRLKRARALLRLVRYGVKRKTFDRENRSLRNAARPLSEVRDATALIIALDSLRKRGANKAKNRELEPARALLRSRRVDARKRVKEGRALDRTESKIRKSLHRIERWNPLNRAREAIRSGLRKSYKSGRTAMQAVDADGSDENLHEWRKRAKDLRYQLEFIGPHHGMLPATASEARKLTDLLGDDHDLAVFGEFVGPAFKGIVADKVTKDLRALADRRRLELQKSARAIGRKLYAKPAPPRTAERCQ